jgi:hypothetical protein
MMAMKTKSIQSVRAPNIRHNRGVWIAILILCAIGAGAAARRIVVLATAPAPVAISSVSASLDAHFAGETAAILLHIVPALLFVLLVPLQFVSSLRRRYPKFHRWSGRVVMTLGVVIGISALWLSAHPVGGIVESAATMSFGCFFLFSLGKAWIHIRNRRVDLHREWVIRMTAIALGVATTRPIMGVFFATRPLTGLTPHQFFGPAMWLGLGSTYLAGEAWIRYTRRVRAAGSTSANTKPSRSTISPALTSMGRTNSGES